MFDLLPKERPTSSRLFKLVTISACGLGIGLGLCGVDAHLYPHAEFGGSVLAWIGAGLMVLSVLGLAVAALVLLVKLVSLMFPR
jgi:hypothetical protein